MKILPKWDYHVHSVFSDGKSTIEQDIERAVAIGLEEIGISDHSFAHCLGGIKRGDIEREREEIERLQTSYPNIKIKLGIEANLVNMDGDIDLTEDDIKMLDYIILGIHNFTFKGKVKKGFGFNVGNWLNHSARHAERITDSYALAFERYPISIVAHPNYAARCNIERLLALCEEHGVMFELNRKHLKDIQEYGDKIAKSKAKLVFSSDAHQCEYIGEISNQIDFVEKFNIDKSRIMNIKIEK
ncbi:MAG: PHP domain-containing protein [Clostridia bacterium]|nr:PHP domain-containing protein [Clostridia bacterium]